MGHSVEISYKINLYDVTIKKTQAYVILILRTYFKVYLIYYLQHEILYIICTYYDL
jgi:hypothetical protein